MLTDYACQMLRQLFIVVGLRLKYLTHFHFHTVSPKAARRSFLTFIFCPLAFAVTWVEILIIVSSTDRQTDLSTDRNTGRHTQTPHFQTDRHVYIHIHRFRNGLLNRNIEIYEMLIDLMSGNSICLKICHINAGNSSFVTLGVPAVTNSSHVTVLWSMEFNIWSWL